MRVTTLLAATAPACSQDLFGGGPAEKQKEWPDGPNKRVFLRALIIVEMLLVPARIHALEIDARLPTSYGELIVVRNDGGIRNATDYFGYGTVCHADLNLRTWLVVKRIVGDHVLVEVDLNVALAGLSCPHGTETSMPYAEARKRYQDYKRAVDDKVFSDLNGVRPKGGLCQGDVSVGCTLGEGDHLC
jgi:hypothetical protein